MNDRLTPPNSSCLPASLQRLADAYGQRLAHGDLARRLGHHLCHAAPENWLSQELAYLVNTEADAIGLPGWRALLEMRRVDVTLLPPDADPVYLELKLVPPDYWGNWAEVYRDLGRHPQVATTANKPVAHYAVCFLVDPGDPKRIYRDRVALVPEQAGRFQPLDTLPPLRLVDPGRTFHVAWPQPVPGRWPDGYRADVRILWVSGD